MRAIDLTHELRSGMPVYPGDPAVWIDRALTVAMDGVEVAELSLGSHAGTHLDAPSHSIPGGLTVDQLPLELLTGPARVLRVRGSRTGDVLPGAIGVADLELGGIARGAGLPDALPAIVCIATGWDRHFTSDGFTGRDGAPGIALTHPWITLDLARELWARGARVLCVDTLSPDMTEAPAQAVAADPPAQVTSADAPSLPVHEFWLGGSETGVIVENLAHLDLVPDEVQLSLLPLRLAGVDGSPIRAIAFVP